MNPWFCNMESKDTTQPLIIGKQRGKVKFQYNFINKSAVINPWFCVTRIDLVSGRWNIGKRIMCSVSVLLEWAGRLSVSRPASTTWPCIAWPACRAALTISIYYTLYSCLRKVLFSYRIRAGEQKTSLVESANLNVPSSLQVRPSMRQFQGQPVHLQYS